MKFPIPKNFLFGAASSSGQIEGGCKEGGKGEDIYDYRMRTQPDYAHADPNKSADFYHRYREDIAMMKELGLDSFRFSFAWSRIYPNGPTEVCQAGIDYYNDVLDTLLEAGIKPFFDLYHCDLPQWVVEMGGFANPEFVDWFAVYAKTCFEAFGQKVAFWSTVNEPNINIVRSYIKAAVIPLTGDIDQALAACHHMILANYKAIRIFKSMNLPGKIGAVTHVMPTYSLSSDPEDQAAAERDFAFYAGWWLDPFLKGHYPEILMQHPYIAEKLPAHYPAELAENFIEQDFIGVNLYGPYFVRYGNEDPLGREMIEHPFISKDGYGFGNYPQGLYDVAMYLKETYPGKEIFITENGISKKKWGNLEEERHDDYRISYMREHLREVSRAIAAGAPVAGYYHWSVMDTNELGSGGYSHIFGLVQVDYETKNRYPRDSWYYYQKVIANREVD